MLSYNYLQTIFTYQRRFAATTLEQKFTKYNSVKINLATGKIFDKTLFNHICKLSKLLNLMESDEVIIMIVSSTT